VRQGKQRQFAAAMAALLAVRRTAEQAAPAVIAPSAAPFDGAPVRDQHGQQIGVYRRRAGRLVAVLFRS
jgi:hypothetical protein